MDPNTGHTWPELIQWTPLQGSLPVDPYQGTKRPECARATRSMGGNLKVPHEVPE